MPKKQSTPKTDAKTTAGVHRRADGHEVSLSTCYQRKVGNAYCLYETSGGFVDSRPSPWPGVEQRK